MAYIWMTHECNDMYIEIRERPLVNIRGIITQHHQIHQPTGDRKLPLNHPSFLFSLTTQCNRQTFLLVNDQIARQEVFHGGIKIHLLALLIPLF